MVLFLRDNNNNTLAEVEINKVKDGGYVELHAFVNVQYYSQYLLEHLDNKKIIIDTFKEIQELRGWLWEFYFLNKQNTLDEYNNVIDKVRSYLKGEASILGDMYYVED